MFDQDKHDPSDQHEENKEEDAIIVNDYIIYEKGDIMRTEGYYVTKAAQVKGNFRFCKEYLQFEPVKCPENNQVCKDIVNKFIYLQLKEDLSQFSCVIDFNDVGNIDMLKLINEKALMSESDQIKEAYMFDYLI